MGLEAGTYLLRGFCDHSSSIDQGRHYNRRVTGFFQTKQPEITIVAKSEITHYTGQE
jgi:hypothetical protein